MFRTGKIKLNPQINLPFNFLIQKYFFHDNPTWNINFSEYAFQVGTRIGIDQMELSGIEWNWQNGIDPMSDIYIYIYIIYYKLVSKYVGLRHWITVVHIWRTPSSRNMWICKWYEFLFCGSSLPEVCRSLVWDRMVSNLFSDVNLESRYKFRICI